MRSDRKGMIMAKTKRFWALAIMGILLTGCGSDEVIGTVYGSEHEYISIGDDTYTVCNNPGVNKNKDKKEKLGIVVFDDPKTDPMTVWSLKGYDDNEYIYTLWVYDGAYYKKDE